MAWPPKIQEAEDRMNKAKEELLAYVESKEGSREKHRGLVAKMQAAIREFERQVATLRKK
jgi:hypothetical protein